MHCLVKAILENSHYLLVLYENSLQLEIVSIIFKLNYLNFVERSGVHNVMICGYCG